MDASSFFHCWLHFFLHTSIASCCASDGSTALIAYVASENTGALILKNPLITDQSETSLSHRDDCNDVSIGFVRAMFVQ